MALQSLLSKRVRAGKTEILCRGRASRERVRALFLTPRSAETVDFEVDSESGKTGSVRQEKGTFSAAADQRHGLSGNDRKQAKMNGKQVDFDPKSDTAAAAGKTDFFCRGRIGLEIFFF